MKPSGLQPPTRKRLALKTPQTTRSSVETLQPPSSNKPSGLPSTFDSDVDVLNLYPWYCNCGLDKVARFYVCNVYFLNYYVKWTNENEGLCNDLKSMFPLNLSLKGMRTRNSLLPSLGQKHLSNDDLPSAKRKRIGAISCPFSCIFVIICLVC